jgi:hypothetical protein
MSFTRRAGLTKTQHGHTVELEAQLFGLHDFVLVVDAGDLEPTRLPLKKAELDALVKMLSEAVS